MSLVAGNYLLVRGRGGRAVSVWPRRVFIALTLGFVGVFLVVPLVSLFVGAFAKGWGWYWKTLGEENSLHAVKMTLLVAAIAVPLNTVFGVAAAWAIAKFEFRGKALLTTIIDLPFAISPVISGLIFVMLFGRQGWFGPWLEAHDFRIIFALPGVVLATCFVTFPFVARELIPLMQEQGTLEEQAAISLGASGWQTFWRVTAPDYFVQRAGDGRIRRDQRGDGKSAGGDEHDAAGDREFVPGIQYSRGAGAIERAGDAGGGDAGGEELFGVEDSAGQRGRELNHRNSEF